jgi:hypothetical protein
MSDAPMAEFTLDSLRETLQQAGYRVEAVADPVATIPYLRSARGEFARDVRPDNRRAGVHPLSRGGAVSLQFGEPIVVGPTGVERLTIRCNLRVNGDDDRVTGTTCWRIHKSFDRPIAAERLDIAIDADLFLGNGIALGDVLSHGRNVYRHLRLLLADARDTLLDLPVAHTCPNESAASVLLVEAKFLGDLGIGRSGLVASQKSVLSASRLRMTAAACDWLKDAMLPDLARAIRAMMKAIPSSGCPVQADPIIEMDPWPHDHPIGAAGNPSIIPALEPVQ